MADAPCDDWISVPAAAKLLGVAIHTAYDLIERGELRADVSVPKHRPKQRRLIQLRRRDVDDYLARARVKPGELHHLFPPVQGGRYR